MTTYNPKYNKQHQQYQNRTYDRLAIRVPKGRRDIYKQLAESRGESLAGMIISMLDKMSLEAGLMDPSEAIRDDETAEEEEE